MLQSNNPMMCLDKVCSWVIAESVLSNSGLNDPKEENVGKLVNRAVDNHCVHDIEVASETSVCTNRLIKRAYLV